MSTAAEFLRSLDCAATPGPWVVHNHHHKPGTFCVLAKPENPVIDVGGGRLFMGRPDADAVAALRTLLPALADVVEAADEVANAGAILSEPQLVTKLRHAVGHLTTAIAREQSR